MPPRNRSFGRYAFRLAAILGLVGLTAACSRPPLSFREPPAPFEETAAPAAPDYSAREAWLAFPWRNGLERSVPAGDEAVDEATAPADVFFIHPTTYTSNDRWNVPIDMPAALSAPVLLNQASVFNGCCRIYAPRYRQSSLVGLAHDGPLTVAYNDLRRAFLYYLEKHNDGRPLILASHSQGTGHMIRLLQDEVLGKPVQQRLVVVYAIGAYVPSSFADIGLPICDQPSQTGCLISWNVNQPGLFSMATLIENPRYWWGDAYIHGNAPAVVVNPLSWRRDGKADAAANPGSMPFPPAVPSDTVPAIALPAPQPGLVGAETKDGVVLVELPWFQKGFYDALSVLWGSYHRFDYGLYYESLRRNAVDRVEVWKSGSAAEPR
ncbi:MULTISPECIES: DUF3089 domain-containing protein [unclassified Azospirillum]|uniref:DUF3089 domain-containing protein n=1 Tax=unclassified Azospirillum TaxID=2630922 RepID=UPI000B632519|nr:MULTISPECIES: DUF3089 domain-containing protein [unclassified Azospirillum]SNS79158.1 Protein of unknown function [Azospirillum sp. RU38E]SNS96496.1 Protein of unknown function [Azospirillum sp. RU37A]